MKKIILGSVLAVAAVSSFNAQAGATQHICSAGTAAGNGAAVAAGGFVKTGFTPKCSANVFLAVDDMTTYYGAGASSAKGKNIFQGSTAGGGVKAYSTCASATGCTATEALTSATSAPAS
jgi:hypothetical protein